MIESLCSIQIVLPLNVHNYVYMFDLCILLIHNLLIILTVINIDFERGQPRLAFAICSLHLPNVY